MFLAAGISSGRGASRARNLSQTIASGMQPISIERKEKPTVMLAPALSKPTSHPERRITAVQHSTPRRPPVVAACLVATATISLMLACGAPTSGSGAGVPHYPDALRAQGKEGTVDVQFVVDPAGVVDSSTIKVFKSTDPAFTAAVEEALRRTHFPRAEVGGHPGKRLVQRTFIFRIRR